MFKVNALLPILLFYCLNVSGQAQTKNNNKIKNNTFYFYPPNSREKFLIVRKDSIQQEINLTTKDSSFWKLTWKNDSSFSVKFLRRTKEVSDNEMLFYDSHILVVKVLKVTNNYYTFSGGLDSIPVVPAFQDTLWFKPKEFDKSN